MAVYEITTDKGVYQVETENSDSLSSQRQDRFSLKSDQPGAYSYGDAFKDTGKTLLNSLADLGENTIDTVKNIPNVPGQLLDAVKHPIETGRAIGSSIKNKVGEYNTLDKFANKVSTDPIGFGSDVVSTALLVKGGTKIIKGGGKAIKSGVNKATSPIRDYAGNKVSRIRSGAKNYWKQEVKAYGDSIDSLAGNTSSVPSSDLVQKLTKTMVDRKLYDTLQDKWLRPLNPVDSKLVKSYETLIRAIDKEGKIPVSKVIKEYQKIRDSVPIDSINGRDARMVAGDVINGIKNHIDVKEFKAANARYADFRNNFDAIDRKINVWGNPLETGKGERFLTKSLSNTKEARLIGKAIESKTGQTLKGAKLINTINNIPGMKLIKR